MTSRLVEDESGASTELGYIFTFMLDCSYHFSVSGLLA